MCICMWFILLCMILYWFYCSAMGTMIGLIKYSYSYSYSQEHADVGELAGCKIHKETTWRIAFFFWEWIQFIFKSFIKACRQIYFFFSDMVCCLKIFSNNKKSLHQLVVSLDKNNSYEAISCVDNNHKMQEIVRSKNK